MWFIVVVTQTTMKRVLWLYPKRLHNFWFWYQKVNIGHFPFFNVSIISTKVIQEELQEQETVLNFGENIYNGSMMQSVAAAEMRKQRKHFIKYITCFLEDRPLVFFFVWSGSLSSSVQITAAPDFVKILSTAAPSGLSAYVKPAVSMTGAWTHAVSYRDNRDNKQHKWKARLYRSRKTRAKSLRLYFKRNLIFSGFKGGEKTIKCHSYC